MDNGGWPMRQLLEELVTRNWGLEGHSYDRLCAAAAEIHARFPTIMIYAATLQPDRFVASPQTTYCLHFHISESTYIVVVDNPIGNLPMAVDDNIPYLPIRRDYYVLASESLNGWARKQKRIICGPLVKIEKGQERIPLPGEMTPAAAEEAQALRKKAFLSWLEAHPMQFG